MSKVYMQVLILQHLPSSEEGDIHPEKVLKLPQNCRLLQQVIAVLPVPLAWQMVPWAVPW
jgi:hypothetical protein